MYRVEYAGEKEPGRLMSLEEAWFWLQFGTKEGIEVTIVRWDGTIVATNLYEVYPDLEWGLAVAK